MADWMLHVADLVGEALPGVRSEQLLAIQQTLLERQLTAPEQLGLIDAVAQLDAGSQVFLLPHLAEMLESAPRIVWQRSTALFDALLGDAGAGLVSALRTGGHRREGGERGLSSPHVSWKTVLDAAAELAHEAGPIDPALSFSALVFLRIPVMAITSLRMVDRAARRLGDGGALLRHLAERLEADERALPALIGRWLSEAPLFVRWLIVRWMGETSSNLTAGEPLAVLRERYERDVDPLVAGEAILSYARQVDEGALPETVGYLSNELRSLERRDLAWEGVNGVEGTREIVAGLLAALGKLTERFPASTAAAEALQAWMEAWPTPRLKLLDTPGKDRRRLQILRAVLGLFGNEVAIVGRMIGGGRCDIGTGRPVPAHVHEMVALRPGDFVVLRAVPEPGRKGPLPWRFDAHPDPMKGGVGAADLLPFLSPRLVSFGGEERPAFSLELRKNIERELDQRGLWMTMACRMGAEILGRAVASGEISRGRGWLFDHLADLALGATAARYPSAQEAASCRPRKRLKDTVVRTFLEHLGRRPILERLAPHGAADLLVARLFVQLGRANVQRGLPGDPGIGWLDENIDNLLAIARDQMGWRVPEVDRGTAALALRYHRYHGSAGDLPEILELTLSADAFYENFVQAVCFFSPADFERTVRAHLGPGAPAPRGPQDFRRRWLEVERLCRTLEGTWEDRSSLERDAASCLDILVAAALARSAKDDPDGPPPEGGERGFDRWMALRLLEAFARMSADVGREALHGNVLRLRTELLRTSSAAQLRLFFAAELHPDADDPHLVRALARLATERHPIASRRGGHVDTLDIKDRLWIPRVVLRALAERAERLGPGFFDDFLRAAVPEELPRETGRVIPAIGRALPLAVGNGELLVEELRPSERAGGKLADEAAALLPVFVHHPHERSELRCLAHHSPAPRGAIDLLDPERPAEQGREELERRLVEHKRRRDEPSGVVLVGRIRKLAETPGFAWVALGGGLCDPRLAEALAPVDAGARTGDPVPIAVRAEPGRICVTRLQLELASESEPAIDLRGAADPIAALAVLQHEGAPLVLRGEVEGGSAAGDGNVRCFLEMGFEVLFRGEPRRPSIVLPAGTAPRPGAQMAVRAVHLVLDIVGASGERSFAIRSASSKDLGGRLLAARLRSQRRDGRRLYQAQIGHERRVVPRSEITQDLTTLHALDALPDEHPAWQSLSRRLLPFVALPDGTLSLLQAPARLRREHVVVGALAGQIEGLTFLEYDVLTAEAIFEARRTGGVAGVLDAAGIAPVGALVRLSDGDLVDDARAAVALTALERGATLSVEVEMGGGAEPAASRRDSPPMLCVRSLSKDSPEMARRYAAGQLLEVRVEPDGSLVATEQPPGGLPGPRIESEPHARGFFAGHVGKALDVTITGGLDPHDADPRITVGPQRAYGLTLPKGAARAKKVRRLAELAKGNPLEDDAFELGGPGSPAWIIGGVRVFRDPLLDWLLPPAEPGSRRKPPIRPVWLTRVEAWDGPSWEMKPEETADALPPLESGVDLLGVVVEVPAGTETVRVDWLTGSNETSSKYVFTPEKGDIAKGDRKKGWYTGQLVRAERRGGSVRLTRVERRLWGTPLRSPVGLAAALGSTVGRFSATLVRRGRDGDPWLFAMAPGRLVTVKPEDLQGTERLHRPATEGGRPAMEAWSLDVVHFEVVFGAGRRRALAVRGFEPGPLHASLGKRVELDVEAVRDQNQTVVGVLHIAEASGRPLSRAIALSRAELPASVRKERLSRGRRVEAWLSRFDLDVIPCAGDDDLEYELQLSLELSERAPAAAVIAPKQALVEALHAKDGRLEERGNLVSGQHGPGVRLPRYEHPGLVPLSEDEHTWISHSGHLVMPPWGGKLAVLWDPATSAPFASLRRRTPRTLAVWLREKGGKAGSLIEDKLYHVGLLSAQELCDCGLAATLQEAQKKLQGAPEDPERHPEGPRKPAEKLVLFEAGPGDTFVVPQEQLRFLGRPFRAGDFQRGDIVESFRVEAGESPDLLVMDILRHLPDIRLELERAPRGIYFGRVQLSGDRVELLELHGVGQSEQAVPRQRLGRWKLVVLQPDKQLLDWLRDALTADERRPLSYLRFDHADEERGELVFRMLDPSEVFQLDNLVYVRAQKVSSYGYGSLKLEVEPLQRTKLSDATLREYIIPDSRFSERRGALGDAEDIQGRLFLAKVTLRKPHPQGEGESVHLSLDEVPSRRFRALTHGGPRRVIAKSRSAGNGAADPERLVIEASPGVHVELPFDRVRWPAGFDTARLHRGDVLFLGPDPRNQRVEVRQVVEGHQRYLREGRAVLVHLWARPDERRRRLAKRQPFPCDILGFSQLKGQIQGREDRVTSDAIFPQRVGRSLSGGDWISLDDDLPSSTVVGRLSAAPGGPIELTPSNGSPPLPVPPWFLSVKERSAADLVEWVRRARWRMVPAWSEARELESAASCDVIAARLQDVASLTHMAEHPHPPDHLLEQMLLRGKPSVSRTFTVARHSGDRLVLELAPGRFADLPLGLLEPLAKGRLQDDKHLDWSRLDTGDEIELERRASTDEPTDNVYPMLRVRSIVPGTGRHRRGPIVTRLQRAPDGSVVLGRPGPHAIPAERWAWMLEQRILDLRPLHRGDRLQALRERSARLGDALCLVGHVCDRRPGPDGMRCFVEIGLRLPHPSRGPGDPSWVPPDPPALGTTVHVRVRGAVFSKTGELQSIEYKVITAPPEGMTVRLEQKRLRAHEGPPLPGDAVLLLRDGEGDSRELYVLGYRGHRVEFVERPDDPLRLHDAEERRKIADLLLAGSSDALWITVEEVDPRGRVLFVSRRQQIEAVRPEPSGVTRARVRCFLSRNRLLVDVLGVPFVMPTAQLLQGRIPSRAALSALFEGRSLDLEVAFRPDGTPSAVDVYALPRHREVDATVERPCDEGVLARVDGYRIFVEARELTYCTRSEGVLPRLFKPRTTLRIRIPQPGSPLVFSHTLTQEISEELLELERAQFPIYVRCELVSNARPAAIVRSRSGLLMDLELSPEDHLGERFPAYVAAVDRMERRVMLSLEDRPIRRWSLASAPKEAAVDALTDEIVKTRIAALQQKCGAASPEAWKKIGNGLAATPRNVRLLLDQLDPGNDIPAHVAATTADRTPLGAVWREMRDILAAGSPAAHLAPTEPGDGPPPPGPAAHFAAGYRLLARDQAALALPFFERAAADAHLGATFDVPMCRARALQKTGRTREASEAVRALALRTWTNAARTFTVPLLEPETADFSDPAWEGWKRALQRGHLPDFARQVDGLPQREQHTARGYAWRVWLELAAGSFRDAFENRVDRFLSTLADDLAAELPVDGRLFGFAAHLCFARGDLARAWSWLDRLASRYGQLGRLDDLPPEKPDDGPGEEPDAVESVRLPPHPEAKVARFWAAWLAGEDLRRRNDIDPLLAALSPVVQQRHRTDIPDKMLDRIWEAYRASSHHWHLDLPACRPLPATPRDPADLEAWAAWHLVPKSLPYLRERCDTAPDEPEEKG